jgi:hypothetical protein
MTEILWVFIAQLFVTNADTFVRKKTSEFTFPLLKNWVPRYAITRYAGLCTRLYALFVLPVAAAATSFSSTAVCVSTFVAWRHGEKLSSLERLAIVLIVIACFMRFFK